MAVTRDFSKDATSRVSILQRKSNTTIARGRCAFQRHLLTAQSLSQHGLKSIAFSALSTGVYGYPSDEAAEVAIEAVKVWLDTDAERASKIDRVVFCQFMNKDQQAYEQIAP